MSTETIAVIGAGVVLIAIMVPLHLALAAGIRREIRRAFRDIAGKVDDVRQDLEGRVREYQTDKGVLYAQQKGRCKGCRETIPYKNMEMDHIHPRSKGGVDDISNRQLLCHACNNLKGDEPMAVLIEKLKLADLEDERIRG